MKVIRTLCAAALLAGAIVSGPSQISQADNTVTNITVAEDANVTVTRDPSWTYGDTDGNGKVDHYERIFHTVSVTANTNLTSLKITRIAMGHSIHSCTAGRDVSGEWVVDNVTQGDVISCQFHYSEQKPQRVAVMNTKIRVETASTDNIQSYVDVPLSFITKRMPHIEVSVKAASEIDEEGIDVPGLNATNGTVKWVVTVKNVGQTDELLELTDTLPWIPKEAPYDQPFRILSPEESTTNDPSEFERVIQYQSHAISGNTNTVTVKSLNEGEIYSTSSTATVDLKPAPVEMAYFIGTRYDFENDTRTRTIRAAIYTDSREGDNLVVNVPNNIKFELCTYPEIYNTTVLSKYTHIIPGHRGITCEGTIETVPDQNGIGHTQITISGKVFPIAVGLDSTNHAITKLTHDTTDTNSNGRVDDGDVINWTTTTVVNSTGLFVPKTLVHMSQKAALTSCTVNGVAVNARDIPEIVRPPIIDDDDDPAPNPGDPDPNPGETPVEPELPEVPDVPEVDPMLKHIDVGYVHLGDVVVCNFTQVIPKETCEINNSAIAGFLFNDMPTMVRPAAVGVIQQDLWPGTDVRYLDKVSISSAFCGNANTQPEQPVTPTPDPETKPEPGVDDKPTVDNKPKTEDTPTVDGKLPFPPDVLTPRVPAPEGIDVTIDPAIINVVSDPEPSVITPQPAVVVADPIPTKKESQIANAGANTNPLVGGLALLITGAALVRISRRRASL